MRIGLRFRWLCESEELLHTPQNEGGRELWRGLVQGLITEVEIRNALMARLATWIFHQNEDIERSYEERFDDLVSVFDQALFGRPAKPVPGIDTR